MDSVASLKLILCSTVEQKAALDHEAVSVQGSVPVPHYLQNPVAGHPHPPSGKDACVAGGIIHSVFHSDACSLTWCRKSPDRKQWRVLTLGTRFLSPLAPPTQGRVAACVPAPRASTGNASCWDLLTVGEPKLQA